MERASKAEQLDTAVPICQVQLTTRKSKISHQHLAAILQGEPGEQNQNYLQIQETMQGSEQLTCCTED